MKLTLDVTTFLQQYWQKQPKVFRQALPSFTDPLDEHDLAGLAELDDIDSRIVAVKNQQWQVYHGPFESFEQVCQGDWTLLVQGVEKYIDDANNLLNQFNFIPNWRLDDLMVSFSVENAGVGPHLDQYDVFIIQGKGSRRWQVGPCNDKQSPYPLHQPHPDLNQVDAFTPIIDEVLQPGDVIYIPPGFPHNGIALENCLNYSVGFRAPNQMQLWENLLQFVHDNDTETDRYQDPDIQHRKHSAQITTKELSSVQTLMQNMTSNPEFIQWFLAYNTLNGQEQPLNTIEELTSDEEIDAIWPQLHQHDSLKKCPGTRTLYYVTESQLLFAINGYCCCLDLDGDKQIWENLIKSWLSDPETSTSEILDAAQLPAIKQFITASILEGWYEF